MPIPLYTVYRMYTQHVEIRGCLVIVYRRVPFRGWLWPPVFMLFMLFMESPGHRVIMQVTVLFRGHLWPAMSVLHQEASGKPWALCHCAMSYYFQGMMLAPHVRAALGSRWNAVRIV